MRHAGGKLPHRGKLLGAQHVALMLLEPFRHLRYAPHDVLNLLIEMLDIAVGNEVHGPDVFFQVLGHVLHLDTEPMDGAAQTACDAVAAEQTAQWAAQAEDLSSAVSAISFSLIWKYSSQGRSTC